VVTVRATVLLIATVLSLVGCDSSSSAPSYLCESVDMGIDGSWAIFWDSAAGTWYAAQREGTSITTADGTANLSGSTLTLSDNVRGSTAPNLVGSGSYAMRPDPNGGLDLSVPFTDGTVHSYWFAVSTLDKYNADVKKMNDAIAAGQ
jgi:hypothetical protein